jgi:hypothetical protein
MRFTGSGFRLELRGICYMYRLPLRIREILYGSASGGAEKNALLSSTHPHNELMRLCLLRRQTERLSAVFRPYWSAAIAFSFNPRILLVNPKYRNWCAQHAFFEGKKAEQTSSRKSTPRTLKGVDQQYPGVFW